MDRRQVVGCVDCFRIYFYFSLWWASKQFRSTREKKMETPGDPTPRRPPVALKSQVKHDQATGRRVRRVNLISFLRVYRNASRCTGRGYKKYENNRRTRRLDANPCAARVSAAPGHTKGVESARSAAVVGIFQGSRNRNPPGEPQTAPEPPQVGRCRKISAGLWVSDGRKTAAEAGTQGSSRRNWYTING
jgi:hypothetical protein